MSEQTAREVLAARLVYIQAAAIFDDTLPDDLSGDALRQACAERAIDWLLGEGMEVLAPAVAADANARAKMLEAMGALHCWCAYEHGQLPCPVTVYPAEGRSPLGDKPRYYLVPAERPEENDD
jgi:hypothetical protein